MADARPAPLAALSKMVARVRARGPQEVVSLGIGRAKEWLSSSDAIVMFVRASEDIAAEASGLYFREARPNDGHRYARDIGTDSAATFVARFSDRTHCFVVESGGRLVHASWVTTAAAWTRELRAYLVPPPGDGYIYESFTRSDARGRGIYPFALRHIVTWGASSGIAQLWVGVEEHNAPSVRAITKAGFREAFRLPYERKLGRLRVGRAQGPNAEIASDFLSRSRRLPHL